MHLSDHDNMNFTTYATHYDLGVMLASGEQYWLNLILMFP